MYREKDDRNYTLEDYLRSLKVLDSLYDAARVVDPVKKIVIDYTDDKMCETTYRCFDTWQRGEYCDNCISIRAFNENKTFVKIEFSPEKVYVVNAIPHDFEGRRLVFELLKDVTGKMLLEDFKSGDAAVVKSMLEYVNTVSVRDELTGAFNRRFINERLPSAIAECVISHKPVSIVMADVDNLKAVNDTLGHLAGDQLLVGFVNIIKSCIRKEHDWVARFGGDEFLICLPDADSETARSIANEIRVKSEGMGFVSGARECGAGCSLGTFTLDADQSITLDEMIAKADENLYKAKSLGKNRLVG